MFQYFKKLINRFVSKNRLNQSQKEINSSYMDPEMERILNGRHVERRIDPDLERRWQREIEEKREEDRRLKAWGDDVRVLQAAAAGNPNGSAAAFIKSGWYLETMPLTEQEKNYVFNKPSTPPKKVSSNRKALSEAQEADRLICKILGID